MLNLNTLKNLYINSPLWIKKLYASIPYDIRTGQDYKKWKKFLEENLNTEEYQLLKLKETLEYAYKNTTYYNNSFKDLQVTPYEINSIKDLEELPLIDKNSVREHFNDMYVQNYPKKNTFFVTTGGSTGEPMKFLQSKNVWSKELAFVNQYFKSLGYTHDSIKASFRGGDFDDIRNNEFWRMNPINNEIHFSPFHINADNIETYVKKLNETQPKFFHTYPSGILSLIENMKNIGLTLNYQVKTIFLISENINKNEMYFIKEYFNCNVSSFFGHSERLIFAPLDPNTLTQYHVDKRYGITELIDNSNQNIYDENIRGELVGTSFDNLAMPLIRYKTGDYTSYNNYDTQSLALIEGRWDSEYLAGENGLKLTLTALNMHSDIFKNSINFQFYQKRVAEVELLIIPKKEFNEDDKVAILNALNKKAGHAIKFSIKTIDSPILTKRGKMKKLIKEI